MRFWLNMLPANKPVPVKRPEAPSAVVAVEEPVQEEVEVPVEVILEELDEAKRVLIEKAVPDSMMLDEIQRSRVKSFREMEAAKAAAEVETVLAPPPAPSPLRGRFIETEDGFLRLAAVQRFEVTEPYPGQWRVDAYMDQFISMKVGMFESEAEARELVRSIVST